jgi:menaquinone-specific isochorismate synthase
MLCQPSVPTRSAKDCKQLYQFIEFCKQQSLLDDHPKVASVTWSIPFVDPLRVLHELMLADELHFYFENRDAGRAFAALKTAIVHQSAGAQRFAEAQRFAQSWLPHLMTEADHAPWAMPRFLGNFTFFDQEPGSCFAPGTIFLPECQIVRHQEQCVLVANVRVDWQSDSEQLAQQVWQQLQRVSRAAPQIPQGSQSGSLSGSASDGLVLPPVLPQVSKRREIDPRHTDPFRSSVAAALASIQKQQIHKLVLAHAVDVRSPLPFNWAHSLHNLRQRHPDCTVFSVGNGRGQSFIGASPERILSIHHDQLVTDALAGSAPRGRSPLEDAELAERLMGSDKERHEHQVVVDFIGQRLVDLGLQPTFRKSPRILSLSNIQHLHTPIHAAVPTGIHPLEILASLHPTPAVAGMPRAIACQQIRQYENFGRSLYAAPLGWMDAQGNAEFVVGIRSALLDGHCARLYAGAGIVKGSDPDRELAEIRLKFQTLLQALV